MNLSNRTDTEILQGLTHWVGTSRNAESHIAFHLLEVESRKLYLPQADSIREFCMKIHRMSRHEAQTRVDAMRLLKAIPEIADDLESGRLSLTIAAQTQSAFRMENASRKKTGQEPLTEHEQKAVLQDLMSGTTREADRKLATHFPNTPKPECAIPVSKDTTRFEFNADTDLSENLERLQTVYYHQTGGLWGNLVAILAKHEIAKLDASPRPARGSKTRSRYVQRSVHQYIWSKWKDGCDFILENGERCGSRRNLQQDHILEYSKGGETILENLRLLCGPHNRHRSRCNR